MVANGMASARQRLNTVEDTGLDTCTTCPSLCRFSCPVAEVEARETTSPHRLVTLAQLVKKGAARVEGTADVAYHCSSCNACKSSCLHDNDVPLLLALWRGRILEKGFAPPPVREVLGHFAVAANPTGASLDPLLKAATDKKPGRGAVSYFPGCGTLQKSPQSVSAFFRAAERLGAPPPKLSREAASCCGLPLLWAGDIDGFAEHAERTAGRFESVERLVVHDPSCGLAFTHYYKKVGVDFAPEVEHVSTYLARAPGRPSAAKEACAYMDNCSLSRELDKDARGARQILGRHDIVELAGGVGADADCCGAQGLLPLTAPGTARAMAEAKIDAFARSGASRLVTASPRCAAHLKSVDPSLPVVDICEEVASR